MERYNRQILLKEIGEEGQRKLSQARVLIVGVGGLGSPIALYLAGAGVGHIGLMDDDQVSESNLQRQVLYSEQELGQPKANRALERLKSLNNGIEIASYPYRLTASNASHIISQYDIVVDGCDNFATRYLINDVCKAQGKPYVYGAIRAFDGQVSVFNYKGGPDYKTYFPEEEVVDIPEQDKGVMGVTPGIIGCAQANEVIKIICGYGEVLSGILWCIDLTTMDSYKIEL